MILPFRKGEVEFTDYSLLMWLSDTALVMAEKLSRFSDINSDLLHIFWHSQIKHLVGFSAESCTKLGFKLS